MDANPDTIHTSNDLIDQFGGISQFTARVTAGG
jgi:hypothetical protein